MKKKDRVELFYNFAREMISQYPKISAAKINRLFKEIYGKGLNKQKYLEIVREIKGVEKSQKR